jgi:hypothetical protein
MRESPVQVRECSPLDDVLHWLKKNANSKCSPESIRMAAWQAAVVSVLETEDGYTVKSKPPQLVPKVARRVQALRLW